MQPIIEANKKKISKSVSKFEDICKSAYLKSMGKENILKAADIIRLYGSKSFAYHLKNLVQRMYLMIS